MNKSDINFFDGNTIVNFSNSLLKHFGVNTHHPSISEVDNALKNHQKVVVMLFDGMGRYIEETHLKENGFIRSHVLKTMQATYPPTTVASTNGLLSGLYPIENGWVSWSNYFPDYQAEIELFTNRNYYYPKDLIIPRHYNIATTYFPYESIFEQIKKQNHDIIVSALFDGRVDKDGIVTLKDGEERLDHILSQPKSSFTYLYWTAPDNLIHAYGVHSHKVHKCVTSIEKYVKRVSEKHPDTLFIVIADHGLIDVKYRILEDYPDLVNLLRQPCSFESRTVGFFVKPKCEDQFEHMFNQYFGDAFVLLTLKEAKEKHVFGFGKEHPNLKNTWPDYIALASSNICIGPDHRSHTLKGHHAGLTNDEMDINIAVFNK